MQSAVESTPAGHILYDPGCVASAPLHWFDPDALAARDLLDETATGRGTTWLFHDRDRALVLRHYRRGGAVARLLRDRYPWLPLERTRAWREWRLLAKLFDAGLPVPQPAAARVTYAGLFYRCDLVTHRIAGALPLSRRLDAAEPLPAATWRQLGATLRRFHDRGVFHADLNAHNLLLDAAGQVYVIDFDRGDVRADGAWKQANLERLLRSLRKIAALAGRTPPDQSGWLELLDGYKGGAT